MQASTLNGRVQLEVARAAYGAGRKNLCEVLDTVRYAQDAPSWHLFVPPNLQRASKSSNRHLLYRGVWLEITQVHQKPRHLDRVARVEHSVAHRVVTHTRLRVCRLHKNLSLRIKMKLHSTHRVLNKRHVPVDAHEERSRNDEQAI